MQELARSYLYAKIYQHKHISLNKNKLITWTMPTSTNWTTDFAIECLFPSNVLLWNMRNCLGMIGVNIWLLISF